VQRKPSGHGSKSSGSAHWLKSDRAQSLLRRFRVKSDDNAEENDEAIICMTKLEGTGFGGTNAAEEALSLLARLHALFWGNERTDAAVAAGISDQTGFWHLDNRAVEFQSMGDGFLKLAARGVDARLKADRMQTVCHGDPKGANIMESMASGLCIYDFQWFGKGPPTKDLVYFLATAVFLSSGWDRASEERYLRHYLDELCALLEKQGDEPPTFEQLHASYMLACFDYRRWAEGGFMWGCRSLLDTNAKYVWNRLCEGGAPKSEAECHDRIFECFPP